MKKIFALLLSAMLLTTLALTSSAAYIGPVADVSEMKFTIPQGYAEHVLDGVITEGEYGKVEFTTDMLSFAAYDDDSITASVNNPISLHMSYDASYIYVAATTTNKNFHNGCDDTPSSIWGQFAIQLSLADVDNDDSASRLETGYALSSETGDLLFANWADGTGTGYDASESKDFIVVNNGSELVYEVRVPITAFSEKNLAEGDAFRFCMVWATGISEGDATDMYIHEQFAYGCTGDPGKDVTGHAVMTLGAALEAPVVEPADTDTAVENPTVDAPATADVGIVAAVAVMAVAAGVILSKKH